MLAAGFRQVDPQFPVFLHPETGEEYALARRERKIGAGYRGFAIDASPGITLQEYLQRRDLTINAIAWDESGHIIDPFNGQADLKARRLRHISPAFAEDPMRLLRVARFAAKLGGLDFHLSHSTHRLMRQMACPACGGAVRVIACIEAPDVIEKILTHLQGGIREPEPSKRPPARASPQQGLFG